MTPTSRAEPHRVRPAAGRRRVARGCGARGWGARGWGARGWGARGTCGARARASTRDDAGAAVVEFAFVGVLLVALLLAVLQVAVYLHVRNILAASAAEGARYGANADVPETAAGPRAQQIAAGALGEKYAATLQCTGGADGQRGVALVRVDCSAPGPLVLGWLGHLLDIDVHARSVKEGQ